MIQFLISLELDEIHMVESPFIEDPKNIILCQGGSNLGGRRDGKFREMSNNRDIYCKANRGWSISKENISPYPLGTKILVMLQFSHMPDQILGKE